MRWISLLSLFLGRVGGKTAIVPEVRGCDGRGVVVMDVAGWAGAYCVAIAAAAAGVVEW